MQSIIASSFDQICNAEGDEMGAAYLEVGRRGQGLAHDIIDSRVEGELRVACSEDVIINENESFCTC